MSNVTSEANQQLPKRSEAKLPDTLSEEGKIEVEQYGWPFFKVGIVLTDGHDNYLLVQEAKEPQAKDGQVEWVPTKNGKWNLPYGRLGKWWHPENHASVIGTRKTAYDFNTGCIRHIGFQLDVDDPYIAIIYHADTPYDVSITDTPDPEEIAAVGWFSYEKVQALSSSGQLRHPELVIGAIENEHNDVVVPNEAITIYASKFEPDEY